MPKQLRHYYKMVINRKEDGSTRTSRHTSYEIAVNCAKKYMKTYWKNDWGVSLVEINEGEIFPEYLKLSGDTVEIKKIPLDVKFDPKKTD